MRLASVAAAALLVPALAGAQVTVYSNNFESGSAGAEFSGAGAVQTTFDFSTLGFGANHLRNDGTAATLLTLSGLAPHTSMTLAFDLAMWDSIDTGDVFSIIADGTALFSSANASFANYFTASDQCEGPGTRISDAFTSFSAPDYGYNPGFRDCARSVSFTFAHSASSVAFSWQYGNSQGGLDESFGIDNVLVQTNAQITATPEPATVALLTTGLAALGLVARRRRSLR